MSDLDAQDMALLHYLRRDGRAHIRTLADHVGLPETTARDRLHRLEREGYIRGYRADVDPHAIGVGVQAWVQLRAPQGKAPDTAAALWQEPGILDGFMAADGRDQMMVRIAASDTARLGQLLDRWRVKLRVEVEALTLLDELKGPARSLSEVEWEHELLDALRARL